MGGLIGDVMAAFGVSGGASLASIQKMSATVRPEAMEQMAEYFDVGGNYLLTSHDGMNSAVNKVVGSWKGQAADAASTSVLQNSMTSSAVANSSSSAASNVREFAQQVQAAQAKIAAVQPVDTSMSTAISNSGGPIAAALNPGAVAQHWMAANEKAEAHRQQAATYLEDLNARGNDFGNMIAPTFPPASPVPAVDVPARLSVEPIQSSNPTVDGFTPAGVNGSSGPGYTPPSGSTGGPSYSNPTSPPGAIVRGPGSNSGANPAVPGGGVQVNPVSGGANGGVSPVPGGANGGVNTGNEWTTPSVYSGTGSTGGEPAALPGGGTGGASTLGLTASALVGGGGALLGAGGLAASGRGAVGTGRALTPTEEALANERAAEERALARGGVGTGAAGNDGEFRSNRYGVTPSEEFAEGGLGRSGLGSGITPGGRGGIASGESELRGNRYGSGLAEEGSGHSGLGGGRGFGSGGMGADETELRGNRYQGAVGEEGGARGAFGAQEELPLRAAGTAGVAESQLAAGERGSMMPPGAGGGRRGDDEQELNRRPDYLVETDDIWGDGRLAAPSVLG